jgi:hypothetical protein
MVSACATKPPTQTDFIANGTAMERVDGTVRAQISRQKDAEALGRLSQIVLMPTRLHEAADVPATISEESRAIVLAEVDRQLCFALSRRFEIVGADQADAGRVQAVVTRLQETNAAASAASAAVSRLLPGGSVRLPVGRGGISIKARLDVEANRQAAAMSWSRGAGVVMDQGSLSEVGDAHRFAASFAKDFADFLSDDRAPKRALADNDPCAAFGPRLDVGRFAAGRVIGLHVPRSKASEKGAMPTAHKTPGTDAAQEKSDTPLPAVGAKPE